ncbi:MAG TPA: CAP domain-containing protein [Caulobacteraceae bacterium]
MRVLFLAGAAAVIAMAAAAQAPAPSTAQVETRIVQAANDFRAENRLPPLTPNPTLAAEARGFAAYLARTGVFSHTADGRDPGRRAQAAGYDYCDLAENLAYGTGGPGSEPDQLVRLFMAGWKASPGHRRNLLDPVAVETGVGVARAPGSPQTYVAVQEFGRPAALRYSFSIDNRSDQPVGYRFDGEHRRVPPHTTMTHSTCATDELVFDRDVAADARPYPVRPDTTYVVTPAEFGMRIEIEEPRRARGRTREQ